MRFDINVLKIKREKVFQKYHALQMIPNIKNIASMSVMQKISIILCMEKYCLYTNMYSFSAFDTVDKIREIASLQSTTLRQVDEEMYISDIIDFPELTNVGVPNEDFVVIASVSHFGIIATFCGKRNYTNHRTPGILQLYDIKYRRKIDIETKDIATVAFFDDKAIVLVQGQEPIEMTVNNIFDKSSIDSSGVIHNRAPVLGWCDPTCTHESRRVYYTTATTNRIVKYNVDTKNTTIYDVFSLGHPSMTGIQIPGIRTIFRNGYIFVSSLKKDGSYSEFGQSNYRSINAIIPHPSEPENLERLLMFSFDNYTFNGKIKSYRELKFRPEDGTNIVRLLRDIFLIYDKDKAKWGIVKIAVGGPNKY